MFDEVYENLFCPVLVYTHDPVYLFNLWTRYQRTCPEQLIITYIDDLTYLILDNLTIQLETKRTPDI